MNWLEGKIGLILAIGTMVATLAGFGYEGARTINRIENIETSVEEYKSLSSQMIELDKYEDCAKINPIFDWTKEEVMTYIDNHSVPINRLHKEGYESVGCEPCTRPGKGRAGRWWWEHDDIPKECGLHEQGGGI